MTFEELHEKALSLPLAPGVYLMSDKTGTVIYVGKAKRLKNRVSQYFQDSAHHTLKTRLMVSQIYSFDVIVARSEFEALVLECSLIKRHMPKYNILLKDDKGYPYLRIDMKQEYPVMAMVSKVVDDGAEYFGPYGGRYMTQNVIDTIRLTLKLPGCSKKFPRDLGKERPCLNYHLHNCDGWCQHSHSAAEYRKTMEQAVLLLKGNYQDVANQIQSQMLEAAEKLEFEQAAHLRDRLNAIESLGKRQLVTAGSMAQTDVIGYYQSEAKGCFTVLHYVDGNLLDKEYEIVPVSDTTEEAVSALVKQFYLARNMAPKEILLPCEMEDGELFSQLLFETLGKKVHIRVPQRGDNVRLIELAHANAREEAERVTSKEERYSGTLGLLQSMLKLSTIPQRIESYDISHIAGTDIVASMVVFTNGRPLKSGYRHFKLEHMENQDDYGAMRQVLHRRFLHYQQGDKGFESMPDLLLIDGGKVHACVVVEELTQMGISVPTFGMVKDNRHRTRALISPDGEEIGIAGVPAVFSLVGNIQEETHRFAITYHKKLRSKRLKASELDAIPGVGEKRKSELLKQMKSLHRIQSASQEELAAVVPAHVAAAIYEHFHKGENQKCE